jgi:cystathionine beta-lyase/cystathionine gamma-synthase
MPGAHDIGGRVVDGSTASRPVVPPIYQSSTFYLADDTYRDVRETGGLLETWYSRISNPTVEHAAGRIAELEGGAICVLTSSGMAAVATTLSALCRAGDRLLVARELYGDTLELLTGELPRWGVQVDQAPVSDVGAWEEALATNGYRALYVETLSNPQLRVADLERLGALARANGTTLVVDNTFASPYLVKPLELGATVVVESVTKFLNGHSDVVAGAIAVRSRDLADDLRRRVVTLGGCLDPHAGYLVARGLQTFEVRLARQCQTATRLAARLAGRDGIRTVLHPSRPDHPDAGLASRLLSHGRHGAIVTLVVEGGDERALRFMRALEVVAEATSLGGTETLASTPFNTSHAMLAADERADLGIEPGMVRLSVGLEDPDLLYEDLSSALDATGPAGG